MYKRQALDHQGVKGVDARLNEQVGNSKNSILQSGRYAQRKDALGPVSYTHLANADGLIYDCMAAFYMACASFMSQNYGAGREAAMVQSIKAEMP